ncbi:hypothetical protein PULV_a0939 [Pseudoalteromonas ulvae UL12]|uniref:Uncharacterized protein n=1 Tax=Pseudoalteromonas ulvae TaxID=107327 RepID=A0A244CRW3_PSEDV|nr:tetratricopeptide repeat protein [Pseudoalteromonas ulvae]MBE0363488.1 hypothetical protein [Pseudoalteromonas ulvae UL12]OUL58360.1 hypothetical protein B1199_08490 [Pseudoalteromonas ulvae]
MKNLSKVTALALLISLGGGLTTTSVMAKPNYEEIEKRKKAKTQVMSERVGKKVMKAFELFQAEPQDIPGAIAVLAELEPSDKFDAATVNNYLGQMYAQIEKYDLAAKHLKLAIDGDALNFKDHAQSMRTLGDIYLSNKRFKEAKALYLGWIDFTGEEDPQVYLRIANVHYELKEYKQVIAPADRNIDLLRGKEPNKQAFDMKIGAYSELKDFKSAVKVTEEVLKTWPEKPKSWTLLGRFYMQVEDYKKGLSTMEIAYKNGYFDSETDYRILASLYSLNDIPWKAGLTLEKALKDDKIKRNKDNVNAMASYFHQAKEISKAAKYYQEAGAFENDAELYRKAGSILLRIEKYSQSVTALNKALELGTKKEGTTYTDLAEAYYHQEKYKQAYVAIKKAMEDPSTRKFAQGWSVFIKDKAARKGVKI